MCRASTAEDSFVPRTHKMIYPLADGNFLAVSLTSRFLVISYRTPHRVGHRHRNIGHNLLDEGLSGV